MSSQKMMKVSFASRGSQITLFNLISLSSLNPKLLKFGVMENLQLLGVAAMPTDFVAATQQQTEHISGG